MPPTNPAMLTPRCEAAPVLVWSPLPAVVAAWLALTALGGGLVELLLVSV